MFLKSNLKYIIVLFNFFLNKTIIFTNKKYLFIYIYILFFGQ